MGRAICVFSASSDRIRTEYMQAAEELGRLIGERGETLVFGGGTRGLMGAVARSVHRHGGHVIGVIPDKLEGPGITYEEADELIVTDTLRERKAQMDRLADAFIALPGGFGTLEEIIEAMTLKQLQYHNRPVVFINTLGFFDDLSRFFEHQFSEGFAHQAHRALYEFTPDPGSAIEYIAAYRPDALPGKYA